MKNKVINAAICDARDVKDESLVGFDSICINAATLIIGERSKALLNKYSVTMNVANVVEVPEGQDFSVKMINGKGEIGPDADGTGTLLLVNGKLTVASNSLDAVKSYYKIMANGKVLMPKSYRGQLQNLHVNGKTEYYPDGAVVLKADSEIDSLFVARASNSIYYCSGNMFFLDEDLDTEAIMSKGLCFASNKFVIAESLLGKIAPQLDEDADILCVPDGARLIDGDLELKPKTIKKYGTKLCVCGDVSIKDAEALSFLEYLFADGKVTLNKDLEDVFDEIDSVYDELKLVDTNVGLISDRPIVKIGAATLRKYPNGLHIEDCAKVSIAEELTPDEIMDKLHISDCAIVKCTEAQEEAVNIIAEDVASIRAHSGDDGGMLGGMMRSLFGDIKDTQVINAFEYKM